MTLTEFRYGYTLFTRHELERRLHRIVEIIERAENVRQVDGTEIYALAKGYGAVETNEQAKDGELQCRPEKSGEQRALLSPDSEGQPSADEASRALARTIWRHVKCGQWGPSDVCRAIDDFVTSSRALLVNFFYARHQSAGYWAAVQLANRVIAVITAKSRADEPTSANEWPERLAALCQELWGTTGTPYADLPESEKEYYRRLADRVMAVMTGKELVNG